MTMIKAFWVVVSVCFLPTTCDAWSSRLVDRPISGLGRLNHSPRCAALNPSYATRHPQDNYHPCRRGSQSLLVTQLHATKQTTNNTNKMALSKTKKLPIKKQTSQMETGIQIAQLLLDKRQQVALKKDLKRQYPLIPGDIIDVCLDMTADAFSTIAPKEFKDALRPGGMEKLRPEIRNAIVSNMMQQQAIRDIPVLKDHDKQKLLLGVMDLALDVLLQDAQEVLAAPEDRLDALQVQQRQIHKLMGPQRLALYRVRRYPGRVAMGAAVVAFFLYQQRTTAVMTAVTATIQTVLVKLQLFWSGLMIPTGKRKMVKRVIRSSTIGR
jgi:hypothetical protein